MRSILLAIDLGAVLLFVVLGKDTHDASRAEGGLLETAAPFLIAVALGWLVTRAWHRPTALLTGAGVAAVTVVAGMVLRRTVFDEGTAATFVVVAAVFLTAAMIGWRAFATRLLGLRAAAPAGPGQAPIEPSK